MKKPLFAVTVVCSLLVTAAVAGQQSPTPVVSGGSYGYGSMRTARSSSSTVEAIGCQIYSWGNSTSPSAYCYASNAQGTFSSCFTSDPALVAVAETVSENSYIYFNLSTNMNNCSLIQVINASQY